MGRKSFLIFLFILAFGGVAFLAAFKLDFLPPWVYDYVYTQLNIGQSSSRTPYLQKFEGHWKGTLQPASAWSDVERCPTSDGTLTVRSGVVAGNLGALDKYITVNGTVDQLGNFSATFISGGHNTGTMSGDFSGMGGSATWKDSLGCYGKVVFVKLDQVVDPVAGKLSSYVDGVTLLRSGKPNTPTPGQSLYEGDVLDVPAGASAHLMVGTSFEMQPVDLVGPTSYTVAAPAQ